MWQTNLIKLYCAVCDNHSTIEAVMQRQSNNFRPQFSDEECITIYLWGISQRRFEQRTIYDYTKNHLLDWFPNMPSYTAFSRRLNLPAPAFQALAERWLTVITANACEDRAYVERTEEERVEKRFPFCCCLTAGLLAQGVFLPSAGPTDFEGGGVEV